MFDFNRSEEKIIKIEKCVKLICMNSNIRVFQIFFDLMLQFQLIIDKTNPGNGKPVTFTQQFF